MYFNCLILLFSCGLFFSSCDLFKTNPVTPDSKFDTGETVELGTQTIGTTSGLLKFTKPGDPLNGISVNVADSTFNESKTFEIAYSTIKTHKFNQYFKPISPLITISNGGGYSNKIIEVRIPAKVPAGEYPLAFFYDESNGKLESVPVLFYDDSTVTIGSRHFETSKLFAGNGKRSVNFLQADKPYSKMVISSISESIINATPIISSGFKIGVDNWEFINDGSYLAPEGHCAGQSIAAMWYYYQKNTTEGQLFNRFSDNPKLWQDNAKGYRFCSVVQDDYVTNGTVNTLFDKYIDRNQYLDKLKFYTIAGALLITGEPQLINIYRHKTDKNGALMYYPNGKPVYGGHALICYQVATSDGKLFICDPNHPLVGQFIEFTNDKFQPYLAKLNGRAASYLYPFITYAAKSAVIDWDKIANRWGEVLNGTIGSNGPTGFPPKIFPQYTIWVNDGTGYELKDGLNTDNDSLSLLVICPNAEYYWVKNEKRAIKFEVYDEMGKDIVEEREGECYGYVRLKPGLNKLGICIIAYRAYYKDDNGNFIPQYVDFKWINVTLSAIETSPIKSITETTATGGGNIESDGGFPITARGVCWSKSTNPTIANSHTTDGSGIGEFVSNMKDLTAKTLYYVKAYATNSKGTTYGNQVSFTTASAGGTEDIVDMSYTIKLMPTVTYDEGTPTIEITATGIVAANALTKTSTDQDNSTGFTNIIYKATAPTNITADITLNCTLPRTSFRQTGVPKTGWWTEQQYSLDLSSVEVGLTTSPESLAENAVLEKEGLRCRLTCNVPTNGWSHVLLGMYIKYKMVQTVYKQDGTVDHANTVDGTPGILCISLYK